MIDYETYCKIRDCHDRQGLTIAQTARALGLHAQTVAKWTRIAQYRARRSAPRASRLDPFKNQVVRLLESHPYSAQQIFQRLREAGFAGKLYHRQGLRAQGAPAAPRGLPQAQLCPRRSGPG